MDGVIHTEIFWGFLAGGSVLPKYWRHLPIFIPCLSNNDFSRFQYIEFITLDISLDSIVKKWVGSPPTPKKAGKLKTAISRPFLVQMSWFFAWDFVITYIVGKISQHPPTPHLLGLSLSRIFWTKLYNLFYIFRHFGICIAIFQVHFVQKNTIHLRMRVA